MNSMNLDFITSSVEKQKKTIVNFSILGIIIAPFLTLIGYCGVTEKTLPMVQRVASGGLMMIGPLTIVAILYEYFIGKKFYDLQKHPVIDIIKNRPESIIKISEVGSSVVYSSWRAARFVSIDIETKDGKIYRLPIEEQWFPKIREEILKVAPAVEFLKKEFTTRVRSKHL